MGVLLRPPSIIVMLTDDALHLNTPMDHEVRLELRHVQCQYFQAHRCWISNNLKSCLSICDDISVKLKSLSEIITKEHEEFSGDLARVKQLIWFLRFRCLADEYYVNESLLLNEDDVEDDDQVRVFSGSRQHARPPPTHSSSLAETGSGTRTGGRVGTGTMRPDTRHRTGILTGRMPSVSSRSGSRASSSYRPLTTSLTATQTAFSRGTRLLLKYAICQYMSKPMFEYLYNAQAATNVCPDYRQCLEYLNLVKGSIRSKMGSQEETLSQNVKSKTLVASMGDSIDEDKQLLGTFWLIAYGTCYFNLRMNKQAEEHFKLAIQLSPNHLDSYAWLIKLYLRCNRLADVLKVCDSGLKNCKSSILYNWMARVQSLVCDSYSANSSLHESLFFSPTNIEALANVGHFAFYSDDLEQALKCFERIYQLSVNQVVGSNHPDGNLAFGGSSAELLNNLALCNFYCGFYHKVIPLFFKAFVSSPNNEVTSDIWYNLSFIPMNFGMINMAISCLNLALKSNSQNDEAMNNLGVLKYGPKVNDLLLYSNRLELASIAPQKPNSASQHKTQEYWADEHKKRQIIYDEAEGYFHQANTDDGNQESRAQCGQPEALYNLAVIKKNRGHLLASVNFCNQYLEQDENNYHVNNMLKDIYNFISFEG